jgi:hypothetical protein
MFLLSRSGRSNATAHRPCVRDTCSTPGYDTSLTHTPPKSESRLSVATVRIQPPRRSHGCWSERWAEHIAGRALTQISVTQGPEKSGHRDSRSRALPTSLPVWSLSGLISCSRRTCQIAPEMRFHYGISSRCLIVDHGLFLICGSRVRRARALGGSARTAGIGVPTAE